MNRPVTVPLRWRIRQPRQRGAALLLAMVILTLVAALAGGMVWQHTRAIQVEGSERARLQSAWVLGGALDWAVLILREDLIADNRNANSGKGPSDHLGEPWSVPLEEARLSTFLAADRTGTTVDGDDGPDAFLSGSIADAQAKWNLSNLLNEDKLDPDQKRVLDRLCATAAAPSDTADRLANAYIKAATGAAGAPLMPASMRDLAWLGLEPELTKLLLPYVTLLPAKTPVNANTASAEVIAAVVPEMSVSEAQRLVEIRKVAHFKDFGAIVAQLSEKQKDGLTAQAIGARTTHFEVRGRLRLDNHALEEISLIRRVSTTDIKAIQRERINMVEEQRP